MIGMPELLPTLYFFVPAYLANMAPVLVQGHFESLATPIDGGRCLRGRRVLGDHKTWRGILVGVVVGTVVYELQRLAQAAGMWPDLARFDYAQHPLLPGFLLGLGTGIGDSVKSFFKRQVGIAPGASWFPFDQLDFLVGAWLAVSLVDAPPLLATLACAPIILAGGVVTSAIGYHLGLKEAWI